MATQVYTFYESGVIDGIPGIFNAGSQVTVNTTTMQVVSIVPIGTPITPVTTTSIPTNAGATVSINPAGTTTNYSLQAGTQVGQTLKVINTSNYPASFLSPGTSNVASGTNEIIFPASEKDYVWNSSYWYSEPSSGYALFVNVNNYGAVGDGVTDSTTSIATAINAVNTAGGGTIFFPAGTYVTGTQLLYSKIHLKGAGIETTTIQLKAATNADLFQGSVAGYGGGVICNPNAANATGSTGGIDSWSISDMSLDGNKTNQSSGTSYPLRFYGLGFILQNLRIKNGYSGGILSDWNGGFTGGINSMEAHVVNLKVHDCNGIGFEWGGPHDSNFANLEVYKSGSHNVHIGQNATAGLFVNAHCFAPATGNSSVNWLIESEGNLFSNCIGEGSDACNVVILANRTSWCGGHIFGETGLFNVYGIQLGQSSGGTPYTGSVFQSAGLTTTITVSACRIETMFSECRNGAINFVSEQYNFINSRAWQTSGSVFNGSPNGTDNIWFSENGITPDGTAAKSAISRISSGSTNALEIRNYAGTPYFNANPAASPARFELANGALMRLYTDSYSTKAVDIGPTQVLLKYLANSAFVINNATNDLVNVNTNSGKVELVNGTYLHIYSDNYSTEVFKANGDASGTLSWRAGSATLQAPAAATALLATNGAMAWGQSASVATPGNNATITTSGVGVARVNPAGNVTGIILQAGTQGGQMVMVINRSAFTLTCDISGTSNVADGTSDVIAATSARKFVWDSGANLWYRTA